MMIMQMQLMARERHERLQREAEMANADARKLADGRPQKPNRPDRLKLFSRR